jgi:hypothetical protein
MTWIDRIIDGTAEDVVLSEIPEYPVDALPRAARGLVEYGVKCGLPAALLGGAALAALAGAIGAEAELEIAPAWHERPIVWVPLIAPRGAGKSPSQDLAFAPLRDHDAQLDDESEQRPVRVGDSTLEALARSLKATSGAGIADLDELVVLLRGLGEYKRGGADRGRFLQLWSGGPWQFTRVGSGGKTNAVDLRIPRPTLVICGGIQPALHDALGGEEDGLRPRWLPHLAPLPDEAGNLASTTAPNDWRSLLGGILLPIRGYRRTWRLTGGATRTFEHYRAEWKRLARGSESASTAAALLKADVHLARVALVLAEGDHPGAGGDIDAETLERAAAIVQFTLNSWRALPEQGSLALSRRDEILDQGITRLTAWLEEHGRQATRRELQRARVAGVRTAGDLDALLGRYQDVYPGTVREEIPERGGLPVVVVKAPYRRPIPTVSPLVIPGEAQASSPHGYAKSDGVGSGDTDSGDTDCGDTGFGDSEQALPGLEDAIQESLDDLGATSLGGEL